jgi:predicted esterase
VVRRACESPSRCAAFLRPSLLLSALLACAACKHEQSKTHDANAHRPKLAPLKASSWLIELDVPGFGKSSLAVPLGAKAPRSIVIALHGSADRPEWACAALRSVAGPAPFVLCPRGVPRADFASNDARYTFGSADDTARELRAALAELKRRYDAYVAPGPVVFAGFELGADQVAFIAPQEPAFFSRLLLIEPSPASWSTSQASLFGPAGGQRVLFAFGPTHRAELTLRALLTSRAGAESRSVFLGDGPVTLESPTRRLLRQNWSWLAAPVKPVVSLVNPAGKAAAAGRPVAPELVEQ